MKNTIYILGILAVTLLFISGYSVKKEYIVSGNETLKDEHLKVKKIISDLNGTWGLTNYFDTIIANKKLAEYRLQSPTWFAILIEIEDDCLKTYGSIESDEYSFKSTNDTLTTIHSYVTGYIWSLVEKGEELHLVSMSKEDADTTTYIYKKRDDLSYFTKGHQDFHKIGICVADYFNKNIFAGKYIDRTTNKEILFTENGELLGIDGFNKYNIRNYFGTLHMHKNLDVVYLYNDSNEYKEYNWVFADDELLLTEFIYETVLDENGISHEGDYLILGEEQIRLKKSSR